MRFGLFSMFFFSVLIFSCSICDAINLRSWEPQNWEGHPVDWGWASSFSDRISGEFYAGFDQQDDWTGISLPSQFLGWKWAGGWKWLTVSIPSSVSYYGTRRLDYVANHTPPYVSYLFGDGLYTCDSMYAGEPVNLQLVTNGITKDHSWNCNIDVTAYGASYYDWTGIVYSATDVGVIYVTLHHNTNEPPMFKYDCFFSVEGVAFFDSQTNKSISFTLSFPNGEYSNQVFTVSQSGSFHEQSTLIHLEAPDNGKLILDYSWRLTGGGSNYVLGSWTTDPSKPDEYDYTIECDWTELNTNSPPYDPNPTNQPPDPPPYNPTNPVLTNWPTPPYPPVDPIPNPIPYPIPYPYDPPGPPAPDTNVPPVPSPGPYEGSSNALTYDSLYTALRNALRDEGDSYDGPMPTNYSIDSSSSNIVMSLFGYGSNMMGNAMEYASNTDLLVARGADILLGGGSRLQAVLPGTIARVDHFHLPWFTTQDGIGGGAGVVAKRTLLPGLNLEGILVDLNKYASIIALFREMCLWGLWLTTYFCIFRIVSKTLGRVA